MNGKITTYLTIGNTHYCFFVIVIILIVIFIIINVLVDEYVISGSGAQTGQNHHQQKMVGTQVFPTTVQMTMIMTTTMTMVMMMVTATAMMTRVKMKKQVLTK